MAMKHNARTGLVIATACVTLLATFAIASGQAATRNRPLCPLLQ